MGHAYGVKNWSKGMPPSVPWPPLKRPEPWISVSELLTRRQASSKAAKRRKMKREAPAKAVKVMRAKFPAKSTKPKWLKQREKQNPR